MSASIKELDFFSSNHQKADLPTYHEIDREDESLKEPFININTRLDVHTSSFEEKPTVQLETLQDEVEKLKDENRHLRSMLESVTQSYTSLQSQIHTEEQKSPSSQQLKKQKLYCAQDVNKPSQTDQDEGQERSSPQQNNREDFLINEKDNNVTRISHGDDNDGLEQASLGPHNQENGVSEKAPDIPTKKARVSIRAESDSPMITDGCQWRKYGQKVAKNNPCPRAYFRCSMGIGCPVRKQVQRCAQDRTVLITTYEGKHNHPLPPAATAVANMTSAAVSMLQSGSKTSNGTPSSTVGCYGLFPSFPFNTTMATITSSSQIPTITLDLTQPPSNHLQFQRPSLSFSSSSSSSSSLHGCQQLTGHPLYNLSKLPMMMSSLLQSQDQTSLMDTVTAAIAADPNFTAALAAAISSVVGRSNI